LEVLTLRGSSLESLTKSQWSKAIRCVTFAASTLEDRHLIAADFEGKLTTWDLEDARQVSETSIVQLARGFV